MAIRTVRQRTIRQRTVRLAEMNQTLIKEQPKFVTVFYL